MKTINVTFDDSEFVKLVKTKSDMSWRSFILFLHDSQQQSTVDSSTVQNPISSIQDGVTGWDYPEDDTCLECGYRHGAHHASCKKMKMGDEE